MLVTDLKRKERYIPIPRNIDIDDRANIVADTASSSAGSQLSLIENYIYLYHTKTFIILPSWPENLQESTGVTFASNTPMLRTAPIYSYSYSGPRSITVQMLLHRDLMTNINLENTSLQLPVGMDYVDLLTKQIQAVALPSYDSAAKLVDPPIVAVRFGDEIYIKGVVIGSVTLGRNLPIIEDAAGQSKYAQVSVGFTVYEITPYDAQSVMQTGSFRGLDTTLERNLWQISTNIAGTTSMSQNFI